MPQPSRPALLASFGALYFAQGIPLGIAAEYLPVVLRENHASYTAIAALSWLQLPWLLKTTWSFAADLPSARARTRGIVLALQLTLALTIAAYGISPYAAAHTRWLLLTALAAFLAANQDLFVDGSAVRLLGKSEQGLGNVAQVGAYRLGIVAGGAGLLSLGGLFSERTAFLALALTVAVASVGALALHDAPTMTPSRERAPFDFRLVRTTFRRDVIAVVALAFAFKLGIHAAGVLVKPALVDAGWSKQRIGTLAVSVGTVAGVLGALAGGLLHRRFGDRKALGCAAVLQAITCLALLVVTAPVSTTTITVALATEHAASGLGTTVLFAALMGAVDRDHAAFQFTVLSTANAGGLALASFAGGLLAQHGSVRATFVLASVLSLAVLPWLGVFERAARVLRSAGKPDETLRESARAPA